MSDFSGYTQGRTCSHLWALQGEGHTPDISHKVLVWSRVANAMHTTAVTPLLPDPRSALRGHRVDPGILPRLSEPPEFHQPWWSEMVLQFYFCSP